MWAASPPEEMRHAHLADDGVGSKQRPDETIDANPFSKASCFHCEGLGAQGAASTPCFPTLPLPRPSISEQKQTTPSWASQRYSALQDYSRAKNRFCLPSRTRIGTISGVFLFPAGRKRHPSVNPLPPPIFSASDVCKDVSLAHPPPGGRRRNSGVPSSGRLSRFKVKRGYHDPGMSTLSHLTPRSKERYWLPRICLPQECRGAKSHASLFRCCDAVTATLACFPMFAFLRAPLAFCLTAGLIRGATTPNTRHSLVDSHGVLQATHASTGIPPAFCWPPVAVNSPGNCASASPPVRSVFPNPMAALGGLCLCGGMLRSR